MHENIIQQLSKPHLIPRTATRTVCNKLVLLRGYGGAHWVVLRFVETLISNEGNLFAELSDVDAEVLVAIQTKCAAALSASSLRNALPVTTLQSSNYQRLLAEAKC